MKSLPRVRGLLRIFGELESFSVCCFHIFRFAWCQSLIGGWVYSAIEFVGIVAVVVGDGWWVVYMEIFSPWSDRRIRPSQVFIDVGSP